MQPATRLTLTLTPADLGRRVMVRHRLAPAEATAGASRTDLTGLLMEWSNGVLVISTADGSTVRVNESALLAAKVIPPPPTRTHLGTAVSAALSSENDAISDLDLDRIMLLGWRGLEAEWHGGWLLRAGGGFTGRANSAIPLTGPDPSVAEVEEWYTSRGLAPRAQVSLPIRADADALLAERGWQAHDPTLVMIAALDGSDAESGESVADMQILDLPDEDWLSCYHYRGGPLPEVGRTLLQAAQHPGFAVIRSDSGAVCAIGRGAIDNGWVGLAAIEVAPTHRRAGLGTAVVRGLCTWAAQRGAHHAYLQVAQTNAGAIAMYERLGFGVHHRYHYRVLDVSHATASTTGG